VSSNQTVTITANYGGGSAQAMLTVTGGGTLPQFSSIIYTATFSASAETFPGAEGSIVALSSPGTYTEASVVCISLAGPVTQFGANFGNVALNGETFTLTGLIVGSDSVMYDRSDVPYAITSGSMTITLSPNGAPSVGSVSGTFTLTSSLATLTGTLSGGYTAQ
jgi:hypothetical protein